MADEESLFRTPLKSPICNPLYLARRSLGAGGPARRSLGPGGLFSYHAELGAPRSSNRSMGHLPQPLNLEDKKLYGMAGGSPFHLRCATETFRVPPSLRRVQRVRVLTLPLGPFTLCFPNSRRVPHDQFLEVWGL